MPPWNSPSARLRALMTFVMSLAIVTNHYALELAMRVSG